MMRRVKTAVIGCGMISDCYFRNIQEKFSILELVGCSDLVPEKSRQKAEAYGIRQMTNEEILADPAIELVLNLTYPLSHYAVSRQILESGKHCYCEKMAAVTVSEAQQLCELAAEKGLLYATAPDTFLGASQQTARRIVDAGLIGTPLTATVSLCRGYFLTKTHEEYAARKFSVVDQGGGIPYDMGGYYLHTLFSLFGPVAQVSGFSEIREPQRPYLNPRHDRFDQPFTVTSPNTAGAVLRFRCGVLCTFLLCSEHHYTTQSFQVNGTEGQLTLGDPNNFGDPVYLQRGDDRQPVPLTHPYREESRGIGAADMGWALRTGTAPRLSREMGLHALEVIEAIGESGKTGRTVTLHTTFDRPAPLPSDYYEGDAMERSLFWRG